MTIKLLNIDCMEYMATQPDNAFDLAIVDPPYGIGFDGHDQIIGGQGKARGFSKKALYKRKDWDSEKPDNRYFLELKRVSKEQIIWGGNYFADKMPATKGWIFWDKCANAKDLTFSDGELAWTSFNKPLRKIAIPWIGFGMVNSGEKKIHPTQKPMQLYRWIFQTYASNNMKILDTHLGSGSSAIAAHYFGCDFVGCEIDEDYYQAACERFDNETKQMGLL